MLFGITAVIVDGQPLRFSYNVGGLLLAFDHDDDYSHINVIFMKVGGNTMQTIKASEFKAKCLRLMDEVNHTGEGIIITKNGKPVSILKPYRTVPKTLLGMHKGKIQSKDDLIAPLDVVWDAS